LSPNTLENLRAEVTCPGYCCERFPISSTKTKHDKELLRDPVVRGMVEPAGYQLFEMETGPDEPPRTVELAVWSCRYWNRETRLCTIYAQRPLMCRTYPDGYACRFCGLTP
jgi:Fe-S-cluster containining protein